MRAFCISTKHLGASLVFVPSLALLMSFSAEANEKRLTCQERVAKMAGSGVSVHLLNQAAEAADQNGKIPGEYFSLVDFSKNSSEPRMYLINSATGEVQSMLVTHGKGSDRQRKGYATEFSNRPGDHTSKLGLFSIGESKKTSKGELALDLDGLEKSNSKVLELGIRIQTCGHMPESLKPGSRVGTSFGSFCVRPSDFKRSLSLEDSIMYAGLGNNTDDKEATDGQQPDPSAATCKMLYAFDAKNNSESQRPAQRSSPGDFVK